MAGGARGTLVVFLIFIFFNIFACYHCCVRVRVIICALAHALSSCTGIRSTYIIFSSAASESRVCAPDERRNIIIISYYIYILYDVRANGWCVV